MNLNAFLIHFTINYNNSGNKLHKHIQDSYLQYYRELQSFFE